MIQYYFCLVAPACHRLAAYYHDRGSLRYFQEADDMPDFVSTLRHAASQISREPPR